MRPVLSACLALLLAAAPSIASAAGQWAEPVKTGQWADAPTTGQWADAPLPSPSPSPQAAAPATARWSERETERLPPGPIDRRLVGRWSVRIPTGASYVRHEGDVYRRIDAGADMARLVVQADGRYTWGGHSGRLAEVRPGFALEGRRYFEASDGRDTYLLLPGDGTLSVLFTSGGVMATGTPQKTQKKGR